MNQMKNRLQGLSLLDRALLTMTDEELETLVASLPDDHRTALDTICGAGEGGFEDPAARTIAIRATAARGRMTGGLEQVTTILTDPCLADCITTLGKAADNPSEAQLLEAAPGLIERHGLGAVRLTFAGSVAGEAAASVALMRVLKHDPVLALPPAPAPSAPTVIVQRADDETKARRKAAKERKQAEARVRREQQLRARNRI